MPAHTTGVVLDNGFEYAAPTKETADFKARLVLPLAEKSLRRLLG
jgi:hypothetical protein